MKNRELINAVADHVCKGFGRSWREVVRDEIIPRYEVLQEKKHIGHQKKVGSFFLLI